MSASYSEINLSGLLMGMSMVVPATKKGLLHKEFIGKQCDGTLFKDVASKGAGKV